MSLLHKIEYIFLVDVNLPKRFKFFNNSKFEHVVDINPNMTDEEIWKYALKENRVIITKDSDFYEISISSVKKPKVILFQLGNLKLNELYLFFEKNWEKIIFYLDDSDFLIVNRDRIKQIK